VLTKCVVTYLDGRVEEFPTRPSLLIAAERHFGTVIPVREGQAWMAWHGAGRPDTFEAWLDTVDDVTEVKRERPTEATGQPEDSSPTSPSEPDSTPEP
jgi:hypothetical protein